jgi:hypothetical protein
MSGRRPAIGRRHQLRVSWWMGSCRWAEGYLGTYLRCDMKRPEINGFGDECHGGLLYLRGATHPKMVAVHLYSGWSRM